MRVKTIDELELTSDLMDKFSICSDSEGNTEKFALGNIINPIYRVIDNKLNASYDGGVSFEPASDYIASYFRWSGNNTIQISNDNITWTNLSEPMTNNLFIKGYVDSFDQLPTNEALGAIYMVGTEAPFHMYVKTSNSWIDNGAFTSIQAGVVQEMGDSETLVMSQKAVSENFVDKRDIVNDLTAGGADKVLSAEMGKELSEEIGEVRGGRLKLEIGGIDSDSGRENSLRNRCRTVGYIKAPFKLSSSLPINLRVFSYSKEGELVDDGTWSQEVEIKNNQHLYRLSFRISDNSDITELPYDNIEYKDRISYIEDSINYSSELDSEIKEINEVLNEKITKLQEEISIIETEIGTIDSDTGKNQTYFEQARMRCVNYLKAPFKIGIEDGFQIRLYRYNLDGSFIKSDAIWLNEIEAKNTSELYRFTIRKHDNSIIESNPILNCTTRIDYIATYGTEKASVADRVIPKSINEESCTFFEEKKSSNIIDWDNLDVRGWSISGNTTSTSYMATDYIKLEPNTTYSLNVIARSIYSFTDADVNPWKTGVNGNGKNIVSEEVNTFTTNDKEYYRILVANAYFNKSTIMLVRGDEIPTKYEPYYEKANIPAQYLDLTEIEDEIGKTNNEISKIKEGLWGKKILTSMGSSGFAAKSGGQYLLTDIQKEKYGVSTDLTATRVLQVLLGYDVSNICAIGGNTASNTMFMCGLGSYIMRNQVVLSKDKSESYYVWNLENIGATMTSELSVITPARIGAFTGYINGVKVYVDANNSTIRLFDSRESDVTIPAGSIIVREPKISENTSDGYVMSTVENSEGLLLQIGANDEGATPEEIVNYFELAIKASGCKWFICLGKNGSGMTTDNGDLNNAITLLKKKYGARFLDHRAYMRSLQALQDQGITPTTSEEYPDINGINSNPLTTNQIHNGVKCDMQCIAEGRYPSSFWHSAYRDNEEDNQIINATHFNAQGLECWGKYMYRMIVGLGLNK
ncbi:MAG: hypothetical protein IKT40_09430 [Bacilli bacterium]|nr:hypothetical protein [Bacilli bacterium]